MSFFRRSKPKPTGCRDGRCQECERRKAAGITWPVGTSLSHVYREILDRIRRLEAAVEVKDEG